MRAVPHTWPDPTVPLTVPNDAGPRALVQVNDANGGPAPPGFIVEHGDGEVTVRWSGLMLVGDDLVQEPMPAPSGPMKVTVIS